MTILLTVGAVPSKTLLWDWGQSDPSFKKKVAGLQFSEIGLSNDPDHPDH